MSRNDDPMPMDRRLYNELFDFLSSTEEREQAADKRSKELVRAHEQGWKLVAGAIERGLANIASAIRETSRP